MRNILDFYPPGPANVPPQFTRPTGRYRLHVALVLGSLALFMFVYLALIAVFAALCVVPLVALTSPQSFHQFGPVGGALLIMLFAFVGLISGFLTFYFLKGLFKVPRGDEKLLEITEAEQPRLFAFIKQVCADTGAPEPAKIFLSHQVNASVFYSATFWSLFVPARKNLHIGLGLVNCLNLSEFKAVLAHEFGHFSQKSMQLGTYVYTANRIIHEIIYGRDWLDESLTILAPVLNAIRWVLGKVFHVTNFAHAGLSRQMEFHADLVAVSVSGSDAIVHGLVRTSFGQDCLDLSSQDLVAASDHNLYTDDLFVHQSRAAQYLRMLKDEPTLGLPPDLPRDPTQQTEVFTPNDTVLPPMWASHPPNFERERNCKRHYLRSPGDDRSAWLLFQDADTLRKRMTQHYYHLAQVEPKTLPSADAVQKFLDAERAETIYAARYHGMYEEGFIAPGSLETTFKSAPGRYEQPAKLFAEHADIFGPGLRERLVAYRARREDRRRLARFAAKVEIPKGGVFQFRDKTYRTSQAEELLETLEQEIRVDREYLANLDRRIFLVYLGMSRQLNEQKGQELEHRYRFHLAIQEMVASLTYWDAQIQQTLAGLTAQREPSPMAAQAFACALKEAQDALNNHLSTASSLRLPAFKNMRTGDPLSFFLNVKPVIANIFGSQQIQDGTWVTQMLQRQAEVLDKLKRLLFKSLGSLLSFQEQIGEQWKARYAVEGSPSKAAATVPTGDFVTIH